MQSLKHFNSYRPTFGGLGLMLIALLSTVVLSSCGDNPTVTQSVTATVQAVPTANLGNATPASASTTSSSNKVTTTASTTLSPDKAATTAGSSTATDKIKIRLSFPGEKETANGTMAIRFMELVAQKTGGRVEVELFPNSSIAGGDQLTAVNMVRADKLEAIVSQASFFGTIDPNIELLNYPFLFSNRENALRFLASDTGKQLLQGLEQYNFKVLAFNDQGFRQISNSKRPVVSPSDLAGLKIRIPQSNLYTRVLKALGAEPVTMNFSPELYKALKAKTLDGQDAPIIFSLVNKYQEVLPYMTTVNYSWDPLLLNFSLNFWKNLPADLQKAISEAGSEVTDTLNKAIDTSEKAALEQFKAAGVQVTALTPEQRQVFVNTTSSIYQEAQSKYSKDLLDQLLKAAQG
ncbi:MAG: TRAP transporter substrate-binding protein [Chloroflexota bacterium]